MGRVRIAAVLVIALSGLLGLPGLSSAGNRDTKIVVEAPDFVKAMAPPAKVDGIHASAVLNIQYQVQETGYWCGPAATRIALSAKTSNPPSQGTLASQLGTTTNGTDWIGQVTGVLNRDLGTSYYETKEMPNDPPTQAQRDLLWRDITLDINNGWALVANIVAPANNHPPGYPNYTIYHYFTVIGYDSSDMTVKIADPANFGGNKIYWLTFNQLATLIPPKGYSA
ncbi:Peptidase_C39 like family protein [Amycolatopsis xylanica]|uniref:Peptidase_C39 like family protein n=2 Tax=Amycolatopsis xylanica TaxID=589385 RepID=A0A1H2YYN8_9PSEU|nr:C39 family peptidase [Amycolatopsis xylanica]SDX09774.1 Peptidase_C39 like family protein [Amycolatopsis xylanica]